MSNTYKHIERINADVKWYRPEKGYGFLAEESGLGDIFLHFSILDQVGFWDLQEGDRISCDVIMGERGRQVLQVLGIKPSHKRASIPQALF